MPPIYRAAKRVVQFNSPYVRVSKESLNDEPRGNIIIDVLEITAGLYAKPLAERRFARHLTATRGDVTVQHSPKDIFHSRERMVTEGIAGTITFDSGEVIPTLKYAHTLVELYAQWEAQKDTLPPDVMYQRQSVS